MDLHEQIFVFKALPDCLIVLENSFVELFSALDDLLLHGNVLLLSVSNFVLQSVACQNGISTMYSLQSPITIIVTKLRIMHVMCQ